MDYLEIYEEGKRFIQTEFDIKHIIASIQELHIKIEELKNQKNESP